MLLIKFKHWQNYNYDLSPLFQAMLHAYFFSEPLPAHHSELPIPQKSKKARHSHTKDFGVEVPITESLIDPDLIAPHIIRSNH